MDNVFINSEDYSIILLWIAIPIPILFVLIRSLFVIFSTPHENEFIKGKPFFYLLLLCNSIIIFSVYEDINMWYDLLTTDKITNQDNKSLVFMLNLSQVIDIGKLLSLWGLLIYYQNIDNTEKFITLLAKSLFYINIVLGVIIIILAKVTN
jgi:hypothetical protein